MPTSRVSKLYGRQSTPLRVAVMKRLERIAALATDLSRELARAQSGGPGALALADAVAQEIDVVRRVLKRSN